MQRLDSKRGQQLHVIELAGGGFQVAAVRSRFRRRRWTSPTRRGIGYRVRSELDRRWKSRGAREMIADAYDDRWRSERAGSGSTYDQVIAMHSRAAASVRRSAAGCAMTACCESALERPVNKWHYEQADLARAFAAARLCVRPRRNHPFVDGNKRIAFMTMIAFLRKNGDRFRAPTRHRRPPSCSRSPPAKSARKASRAGSGDNWPKPLTRSPMVAAIARR